MIRKSVLLLALAAVLLTPVALYAYSAWVPSFSEADMASVSMLGRAIDLTGLLATSSLAVTLILIVRLRVITRTISHPVLAATHRYFGVLTLLAGLAHLGLLAVQNPDSTLRRLDFVHAPLAGRAGTVALLSLIAIAATSRLAVYRRKTSNTTTLWRERRSKTLRARHPDLWRALHAALATCAAAGAAAHVYFLDHMVESPPYRTVLLVLGALVLLGVAVRFIYRPWNSDAYRVVSVQRLTPSIITLTLSPPPHHEPLSFRAGQFAYLRLKAVPTARERPFTISSSHAHPGALEFTIRVSDKPRSFTQQLLRIRNNQKVWVDGPHGTLGSTITLPDNRIPEPELHVHVPPPPEHVPGMIGITSGVGITPCLSLLRTLADVRDSRHHSLLVAVRSPNDLLTFRPQLVALKKTLTLNLRFARIDPAGPFGPNLSAAEMVKFLPAPGARAHYEYVLCGPQDFVTNVYVQLLRMDVPRNRIHTETILSGAGTPLPPPPAMPEGHPSSPGIVWKEQREQEQAPTAAGAARAEAGPGDGLDDRTDRIAGDLHGSPLGARSGG